MPVAAGGPLGEVLPPFGGPLSPLTPPLLEGAISIPLSRGPPGALRVYARLTCLGRKRSLCIYGPTRVGKTTWARSLGMHVYFMGMISGEVAVRDMPTAEYAVFDDMRGGIKFFPAWKEWFGSQQVVTVKKLYRDPLQIKWGKPCIWLSNADPRSGMEMEDIEWLEGNCDFVFMQDSIIAHANST